MATLIRIKKSASKFLAKFPQTNFSIKTETYYTKGWKISTRRSRTNLEVIINFQKKNAQKVSKSIHLNACTTQEYILKYTTQIEKWKLYHMQWDSSTYVSTTAYLQFRTASRSKVNSYLYLRSRVARLYVCISGIVWT